MATRKRRSKRAEGDQLLQKVYEAELEPMQLAETAGLSDRVRFELCDYRKVTGQFDRVFSVGILEHVGAANLGVYFDTVRDRLAPDGVAMTHSIMTTKTASIKISPSSNS